MTASERNELQALCEAILEDRLSADQRQRLEELVLHDAEARRCYVEYLHQHAALCWSIGDAALLNAEPNGNMVEADWPFVLPLRRPVRSWRWSLLAAGLVAAGLLLAVGAWWGDQRAQPLSAVPVATLASGKSCKWEAGSLPTESGARLTAGRLRLAEGLARIVFDSGAEITLEAPADFEVVSAQRCILHDGRLVAKVPPSAHGFLVDTPRAVLKDLGTEFGVSVRDADTADVQVFDGVVDVEHRDLKRTERMETGRKLRFAPNEVVELDPQQEGQPSKPQVSRVSDADARVVDISTAAGRGKDAYVQPLFPIKGHTDTLLMVKHSPDAKSDYNRKAYIGIDLSSVARYQIVDAQLTLAFTPTELGFASEVPDATFSVYGLTDESLDHWDETAMRWHDAPANRPGAALDTTKVVWLGTFQIMQGELSGTRSIGGPALLDFLRQDTNRLVTFIVVRDTPGSGRSCLVHGFASKEHPTLTPPTLKLTVMR
ncbi:MAG: DNRLRE domain-containing protein [Gemmataceae bacterium]